MNERDFEFLNSLKFSGLLSQKKCQTNYKDNFTGALKDDGTSLQCFEFTNLPMTSPLYTRIYHFSIFSNLPSNLPFPNFSIISQEFTKFGDIPAVRSN